jgi:hypothetical protein
MLKKIAKRAPQPKNFLTPVFDVASFHPSETGLDISFRFQSFSQPPLLALRI